MFDAFVTRVTLQGFMSTDWGAINTDNARITNLREERGSHEELTSRGTISTVVYFYSKNKYDNIQTSISPANQTLTYATMYNK